MEKRLINSEMLLTQEVKMAVKIGLAKKRNEKLQEELKRLIPEIIKLGVEKVILFGSLASGDIHKSSDIDIIIVQRTEKKFLDRLEEFYNYLRPEFGMDIFVYTPEEFSEMKENNRFMKSVLKNGRILYEK